jgi:hypothetical protein
MLAQTLPLVKREQRDRADLFFDNSSTHYSSRLIAYKVGEEHHFFKKIFIAFFEFHIAHFLP